MTNRLETLLGGYRRSRSREYLLTTRLVYDLGVAAAASGYDLLVYLPTVDADGFDVIFDDKDRLVAMQLKSVVAGGRAGRWKVRRSLLRPEPDEADLFGFEPSPKGTGRGGGVILTTARAVGETVQVDYSYTDIAVLSVLWLGILPKPKTQIDRLLRLREDLVSEATGSIDLPRSAFVRAAMPQQLLALAGLHSYVQSSWRSQLRSLLRYRNLRMDLPASETSLRSMIAKELQLLAGRPAKKLMEPQAKRR